MTTYPSASGTTGAFGAAHCAATSVAVTRALTARTRANDRFMPIDSMPRASARQALDPWSRHHRSFGRGGLLLEKRTAARDHPFSESRLPRDHFLELLPRAAHFLACFLRVLFLALPRLPGGLQSGLRRPRLLFRLARVGFGARDHEPRMLDRGRRRLHPLRFSFHGFLRSQYARDGKSSTRVFDARPELTFIRRAVDVTARFGDHPVVADPPHLEPADADRLPRPARPGVGSGQRPAIDGAVSVDEQAVHRDVHIRKRGHEPLRDLGNGTAPE